MESQTSSRIGRQDFAQPLWHFGIYQPPRAETTEKPSLPLPQSSAALQSTNPSRKPKASAEAPKPPSPAPALLQRGLDAGNESVWDPCSGYFLDLSSSLLLFLLNCSSYGGVVLLNGCSGLRLGSQMILSARLARRSVKDSGKLVVGLNGRIQQLFRVSCS